MNALLVFAALSFLPMQIPGLPAGAPDADSKKGTQDVAAAEKTPANSENPPTVVEGKAAPTKAKPERVLGPCETPKQAVLTWLGNLQAGSLKKEAAAECAFAPAKMDAEELQKQVWHLKKVFDARGVYIRVDSLSEKTDYVDEVTGTHRALISKNIPQVTLIKVDGKWGLSPAAIKSTESLYRETFPLDLDSFTENFPTWTKTPVFGISAVQVLLLGLLLLLGWIARVVVSGVFTSQLRRVMHTLNVSWGNDLLKDAASPLGTLALSGVVALGLTSIGLGVKIAAIVMLATQTVAATSVVMVLYRAVDLLAEFLTARADKTDTKLDDQLVPLVRRGLKIVTVCVGAVFVLQNLDIDVGSLIAGLGIGGLAFALAAKDTVSHIFGSVTIFLDKPFQIGDWVVACGVEGIIEEVGFRSTRVRTFYNSVVSIPNGKFTNAVVDNYGLRQYRRCSITLNIEYATSPDQVEAFCDGLRGVIQSHPGTRKDYFEVHFAGFSESGLKIMLYFFFEVDSWTDELRSRHEIYLDFIRLAEELDVRFAYPTQTLHIASQTAPVKAGILPEHDLEALKAKVSAFGPGGALVIDPGPRVHSGFYSSGAIPRGSE
ncbi:MAG: mechanosensitive ion channel family protein [Deltaproteobacteria bacterium]|nr:mechanosensitive ion channel family protein [Deltaproteobacteria bacterium]